MVDTDDAREDVMMADPEEFPSDLGTQQSQQTQEVLPKLKVKTLSEERRKKAETEYGDLYREAKNLEIEMEALDFKVLRKKMKTCVDKENACLEKYGINETFPLDSKNFNLTTRILLDLGKKIELSEKINLSRFLRTFRSFIFQNAMEKSIGRIERSRPLNLIHAYPAGRLIPPEVRYSTPAFGRSFIYGNTKTGQTATPVTSSQRTTPGTPRKRTKFGTTEVTQPTQKNVDENVDQSDKRLLEITSALQRLRENNDDLPFLQVTLNPNSFTRTVENLFNIAFLARQERIMIVDDEDDAIGEPIIRLLDNKIDSAGKKDETTNEERVQAVLTIDMDDYNALIEKLEITQAAFK